MDRHTFVEYWGAHNLKRWTEGALDEILMPKSSKTFLLEVGLPAPKRRIWRWELEWNDDLPLFPYARRARLLGAYLGVPRFVIDEERGGCVTVPAIDDRMERNVNTSIEQFAESLTEFDKAAAENWSYDDWETNKKVTALWRRLKGIDAAAIADPESLWSSNIFEMRLELSGARPRSG